MFEEKNETIMDDQHYSVRGIRDFIQNLQQPLVYVVCANVCEIELHIYIWKSVFNNDNMSIFFY